MPTAATLNTRVTARRVVACSPCSMLRSAPLRASAATLGLAIFVDVPSKNQPHALQLKRADAAGVTYRGVAANATQSSLRNFQLFADAVFAPCDESTFDALKRAYGGWSASRSAVAWESGRDFRLSDLLPPLAGLCRAQSPRRRRAGCPLQRKLLGLRLCRPRGGGGT